MMMKRACPEGPLLPAATATNGKRHCFSITHESTPGKGPELRSFNIRLHLQTIYGFGGDQSEYS